MNLKTKLSQRIGMHDIYAIIAIVQGDHTQIQAVYELISDPDETVAYQAVWILTHLSPEDNRWLYDKQNELIDEVLVCPHPGKRRLILSLLYRQPLTYPSRVDLLDFCLERMVSKAELPAVQTLCMKLAYELCRPIPELLQEFRIMMDIMEPELLPISVRTVRKNVLKALSEGKSLQGY